MNKKAYLVDKSAEMQLPVFTNHNSLYFYSDDSSSHQQLITLYNPYSFNIKYKVLSTAREKYKVYNPEGSIKAGCSIDLIFKHLAAVGCKENVSDRFRIQVMKQGSSKIIGKKELESVLMPTALKQSNFHQLDDDFQSLPNVQTTSSSVSFTGNALCEPRNNGIRLNWWMALTIVLLITFLFVPLQNEPSPLPPYFYATVQQKHIACYILGLLTLAVLRNV